jgi:nucleotide-binding universal stress UspA family protein
MAKIVIGFDGSSESRDALHLGSAMGHAIDADLIVATASNPRLDRGASEAEVFAGIFNRARQELPHRDFAMRELRDDGAVGGLKDLAAREQADLIVIGSTHRGQLGRVVPGSVGERLLSGAPCPVAVAPRGYASTEHFGLGLIGVAFDGSRESHIALREAITLAKRLDSMLRVVTIVPSIEADADSSFRTVMEDHGRDVRDAALDELPSWVEVESALEEGDPARALARHGVELDLLVIGSRGYGPLRRTLLGGVSADVMRTAPCPVIAIPPTAAPLPADRGAWGPAPVDREEAAPAP